MAKKKIQRTLEQLEMYQQCIDNMREYNYYGKTNPDKIRLAERYIDETDDDGFYGNMIRKFIFEANGGSL